jgi:hypothetical protein
VRGAVKSESPETLRHPGLPWHQQARTSGLVVIAHVKFACRPKSTGDTVTGPPWRRNRNANQQADDF